MKYRESGLQGPQRTGTNIENHVRYNHSNKKNVDDLFVAQVGLGLNLNP
jgi:hypothetical protein